MTDLVHLYRLLKLHNLPLLLAILLLLVSVLMSPFSIEQPVYDVQITFDISQSMNVEDVKIDHVSVSRLDLAKAAARELLVSLPCGSRVGWGVFTGRRSLTLLTPLDVCLHYAGLLSSLDRIDGSMRWVEASSVGKGLHQSMRAAQSTFDQTGGLHAAAAFDTDGIIQATMEDVGRHNAVDKVVGRLLMDGNLPASELGMMVSGRASFELMQKTLVAGIPLLAAVSAPSSLAVQLAREFNMTLVGFLRGDTFNIYAGDERICL